MGTRRKRTIFFSLLLLFFVYTFYVATNVTDYKKGTEHLSEISQDGKLLFQKYNCIACHQLYGLGGYMGPDLTNVMSQKGKGEDYVRAFLKSGTTKMPDFKLSEKEIAALTGYLNYVDKTGSSTIKNFSVNAIGIVESYGNKE